MKRFSILAALACALCMAAPATANKTVKYRGHIDPSGRVAFKLLKGGGKKKVNKFKWAKLPVTCKGKERTTSNRLGFKIRVQDDKTFSAKAVLGDAGAPDAKVEIAGTLLRGGKAEGTIKVGGRALPLDNGRTGRCHSGKLDWRAAR